MVAAGVEAGAHGVPGSVEDLREGLLRLREGRADADGEWDAVTPPAEVGGAGEAGNELRESGNLRRPALLREDEKLIIPPAAEFLLRTQTVGESAFDAVEHGFTRAVAMRVAKVMCLIDGNPEQAEGNAALPEVVKRSLNPLLKLRDGIGLPMILRDGAIKRGVLVFRGMEEDGLADALSEIVTKDESAGRGEEVIAKTVACVDRTSAARLRNGVW